MDRNGKNPLTPSPHSEDKTLFVPEEGSCEKTLSEDLSEGGTLAEGAPEGETHAESLPGEEEPCDKRRDEAATSMGEWSKGDIIDGLYRVENVIRGGMGILYFIEHL